MSTTASTLPDIQRTRDTRDVTLRRVGVTDVKLPIKVAQKDGGSQQTLGTFELACDVPRHVKGTHMSRFSEVLNHFVQSGRMFSAENLPDVAAMLLERMEANKVFIKVVFPYFIEQAAPVSGRFGLAPITSQLTIEATDGMHEISMTGSTGITILGKTCCPCSREISGYDAETGTGKGAHAQRGEIGMTVTHDAGTMVWFEDLVQVAWAAYSSPVYAVLKRPDEKHVTETAYGNPKFVEDVMRDTVVGLRKLPNIDGMNVRVQNAESIHYHDAYAEYSDFRDALTGKWEDQTEGGEHPELVLDGDFDGIHGEDDDCGPCGDCNCEPAQDSAESGK